MSGIGFAKVMNERNDVLAAFYRDSRRGNGVSGRMVSRNSQVRVSQHLLLPLVKK
jgi:hypothetical protein